MTIYLYKKTHNKTGLQYLGKTIQPDPHKYKGSGVYWTDHINQHGYDVTTEILKECETKDELMEWGLYYSTLWNIVDERDSTGKKTWANLEPESGAGFTSEQARLVSKNRIDAGSHHLMKRSDGTSLTAVRTTNGTNPFSKRQDGSSLATDRVEAGTHNFLGDGEFQRSVQQKLIAAGTHHLLNKEAASIRSKKRVNSGKHNFLGPDINKELLARGKHPSQIVWTCEHCGTTGKGKGIFTRFHGDKCKEKL